MAIVGTLLYRYVGSTAKQVEKFKEDRPLAHARLAADQATLASMQQALQTYRATNEGKLPPDKAGVVALLAGPPRFQCEGGDFDYGTVDILYRPDDGSSSRKFETFSQELRLNGHAFNDKLDWLVLGDRRLLVE